MTDGTGETVIVFAGEVHNYVELRARYEACGARFRTGTDTEVVLEGYRLFGERALDDFVGMFSFAVWDARRQELFLARDRLGEKPLYWCAAGGCVWFASVCSAFAAIPGRSPTLSAAGLAQFAAAGSFLGESTIFEATHALPPGSWARVRAGDRGISARKWWSLDFHAEPVPESAALDEYDSLITDAVRVRLRSDVPASITFSGGVDSGTIAAIAAQQGADVRCVTLDFEASPAASEETRRAETVARHLGLDWRLVNYQYRDSFLNDLEVAYATFDQPSSQPELVQISQVARAISESAVVALTGIGADELFLGYTGDEQLRRVDLVRQGARRTGMARLSGGPLSPMSHLERRLRRNVSALFPGAEEHLEDALAGLREEAAATGASDSGNLKMLYTLRWGNVEPLYRSPDIAGLASCVEFRAPFLDHRLVEFSARLSGRMKVRRPWTSRTNKWIAKRTYAKWVGDLAWLPKLNMGANLRWDLDLARRPAWREEVERRIAGLERHGLDTAQPLKAWNTYAGQVRAGRARPAYAAAIRAFMLALWLDQHSIPAS